MNCLSTGLKRIFSKVALVVWEFSRRSSKEVSNCKAGLLRRVPVTSNKFFVIRRNILLINTALVKKILHRITFCVLIPSRESLDIRFTDGRTAADWIMPSLWRHSEVRISLLVAWKISATIARYRSQGRIVFNRAAIDRASLSSTKPYSSFVANHISLSCNNTCN